MIIEVEGYNTQIEFPDNTPTETITKVLRKNFPPRKITTPVPSALFPHVGEPFDLSGILSTLDPAETHPNKTADIMDILYPFMKPYASTGLIAASSLNSGMAAFATHLDTIANYIGEKTGTKPGGIFGKAAKQYEDNTAYWQERAAKKGPTFLEELLGSAIGGAVPGVAEFMLNIPYAALFGAAEAEKVGGSEIAGALTEAAKRGVLGLVFKAMSPLKQYLRAPAMGGVFATQAAMEGGDIREIAMAGGTGALYSLASRGGQMGLNEVRRNIDMEIVKKNARELPPKKIEEEKEAVSKGKAVSEEPEAAIPKEPWQMTKAEYDAPRILYNVVTQKNTVEEARPFIARKTAEGVYPADAVWSIETINGEKRLICRGKGLQSSHESWVRKAIAEGESVPENVLADYPDLQAKIERTPTVTETKGEIPQGIKPEETSQLKLKTEEKVAKPEATITKEEMPKELKVLAESIKNYKNVAEFRKAYTQSHLMDLSNPEMHRWGRALAPYKDAPHVDIPQIISDGKYPGSYLTTIKYEYPQIYRSIVSPSDKITVYRAVPEDKAGEGIQIGDYVALDREYAQMHLTSVLEGEQGIKGKIISNSVPKSDIIWGNADFREWVYSPKKIRDYAGSLEEFYETVNSQTAAKGVKPEETIPIELEPLAKEARKHKSAEEFEGNIRRVLEKRLPDLRNSFAELEKVTTRIKGERGKSKKTIQEALDVFESFGKQIRKEIATALGYKEIGELPYELRNQIKNLTDQFTFEPTSERWLDLINKRLSEITKGKSLTDFYNQAVKAGKNVISETQQAYNLKGELENDFETYSDNLSTATGEVVRPGGREGAGISTLGKAITDELVAKGRIDLRGKTVKTADELATVAQVFRDPRVETARFFYVDDNGKILAHEGISSRMPNSSEVFVTDRARAVQDMKERMERLGATGYWMLHNHPTGQPFPSFADINVTRILAKKVPGFKGHIVIDSGKYGFIQQDFKAYIYDLPNLPSDWVDPLLTVGKEHAALGKAIKTSSDLANIGQSLKRPENYTTLIFRGGDGKVRAIQNVPNGMLKNIEQASGYLRNRTAEFGAPDVFAYTDSSDRDLHVALQNLFANGSLRDVIHKEHGRSYFESGAPRVPDLQFGRQPRGVGFRVAEESFDDINLLLNAAARTDEAAGLPPTDEYDKIRMQAAKLAYEKLNKKLDLQKRKEERLARQQGEEAARMDPVFRAMQEAIDAGGLHKDSLLAIWDKDTVDELAKKRVGLVRPDGKVALDDLASRYPEFESDDALMSAMLEWEGIAETGKRLASQFQQFYGAMLSNAELEDFHIMLLDEEEKILGKLLPGKKKPSARGIKKVIRENTGQIRIEDLTVSSYEALTAAMKKAEVAARKAFRAGNIEGTLSEKARQKDLAQARKERLQAKEETKKLHDGLIKLLNDKNIPEDYHDRIAALLEDFDLAPRSARWARRVESAREFMERKKAEGEDVQIPESMLARIERYGKVHWRKLTLDQLREIYDQAEMYANLGKLKDKLLANKEARSREDGVQLMLSEIHKNWGIRVPTEEEAASILLDPTLGEKLLEFERGYFTSLIKAETIIRRLDGFKDMGPIWKLIWLPIQESSNAKYRNIEDISKALESLFGAIGDSLTGKKFKLPGVPQFLTQRKVIMAALNSGNEGNLKALQENDAYGWNDAQIETILGKVTPEEWEFAKGIWGLYEKQYSELAKKYKIMTGTTLKKVPGNYFPLVFDRRLSWLMDKHAAEAEEKDFFKTIYTKPSVTTGRVIERTGGTLPPKLDFSVIFQTLADVNHYVTHVEAVRDAQRILYDPRVRAAIEAAPKDIGGPEAYAELVGALQDIAHPRREPISSMERGITYLRNATTVCQLGMKATVIMSQLFGLGPTTYKLGLPTAIKGFLDFYTHPHELMNKIKSLSPEMAARPKHIERDMRDLYEKLGLELSKVGKFSSLVRDASFGLIVMTDMAISYPTWWGAYNKALAEKGYSKALAKENYSEQEAINYADMMVRTSQGSSLIKDLAGIQRGSELKKLLTLYYTFFSAYHNMMSDAWVKFKYRKSTANFVDLFRAWWWVTIVPLVLEEYMRRRRGLTPREFVKGIIQYRLGGYPVIRDMAGAIFGKYDYEFTPAAASLEKMSMAGKENLKLVTPGAEKRPAKAFQYTFESMGYLFKFPTSQMMITAQGFNDLLGGETNDLTRLLFRSPQEEIEGTGWEELFGTPEFPSEEGQMSPLNEEDLFGVAEE